MKNRKVISICMLICLALLTVPAGSVRSEESDISGAANFLIAVNSPRATGMGGCVVNLVDANSGLYNPGATGLFHLDRIASFAVPNNTKWLPELAEDMRLKTWNISLGGSYRLVSKSPESRFNASLALSFARMKLDYGEFARTSATGEALGTIESFELVKTYTVSFGVEYYARFGIGYAVKKIESQLPAMGAGSEVSTAAAEGDAHDWGVILELPIHSFFPDGIIIGHAPGHNWRLEITPSYAYVKSNIGDDIAYIDAAQTDPLPKTSRSGLSVATALTHNNKPVLSTRLSKEDEKLLLGDEPITEKKGIEIGFFGTLFIRSGSFDSDFDPKLSTQGFGFRLSGLIDWLGLAEKPRYASGFMNYLINHLDLSYDSAKWKANDGVHAADNIKFAQLSLSF